MSTDTLDPLDPNASPDRAQGPRVRRINQLPLLIGIGVVLTFVMMVALVAWSRAQAQKHIDAQDLTASGSGDFAKALAGDREGYIPPDMPVVPDLPAAEIREPLPSPAPPTEVTAGGTPQPDRDEERERIRQARMARFEEALTGSTVIQAEIPRARPGAVASRATGESGDATVGDLRQLQDKLKAARSQIGAIAGGAGFQEQLAQLQGAKGSANPYLAFDKQGTGDRWRLGSYVEAPTTPYLVRAGAVIPATLISGINSELPGQIVAQVSQDVFDTATGQYLLIPHGTKIVGQYSSEIVFGQRAVLTAWQRLTFPDAKVLDIGAMQGSDSAGYAGFRDKVNNHLLRTFGSALLMSIITAGVEISQDSYDSNDDNSVRAGDVMSASLGQELGSVSSEVIRKNMNVSPTLEIRQGYRLNVMVTKDLELPVPYQSFDYSVGG